MVLYLCAKKSQLSLQTIQKYSLNISEEYEKDVAFQQLIIECGNTLNTLELVVEKIRFPLLYYFETLSIYMLPKVEKFMVFTLRRALDPKELAVLELYDTFKGQHGQTDEQKEIKHQATLITAKLTRWYIKIGNSIWPPQFISAPAAFTSAAPAAPMSVPTSGNNITIYLHIITSFIFYYLLFFRLKEKQQACYFRGQGYFDWPTGSWCWSFKSSSSDRYYFCLFSSSCNIFNGRYNFQMTRAIKLKRKRKRKRKRNSLRLPTLLQRVIYIFLFYY